MIFIVVKFPVRAEHADGWLELVRSFTENTRAEPGNLFFDWSRSVDDPNEFVLLEAFRDPAAGEAHVRSAHFQAAMQDLPPAIAEVPRIVNVQVDGDDWSRMGELAPR